MERLFIVDAEEVEAYAKAHPDVTRETEARWEGIRVGAAAAKGLKGRGALADGWPRPPEAPRALKGNRQRDAWRSGWDCGFRWSYHAQVQDVDRYLGESRVRQAVREALRKIKAAQEKPE
jgi:hypothetical protein